QRRRPRLKLGGRNDRQHPEDDEHKEFGQEGRAVQVVVPALLEQEHPQQPDDEEETGGNAEHDISRLQPSRGGDRQLLPDQRKLDRDTRDQREGAEMVEEGEQRGHETSPYQSGPPA